MGILDGLRRQLRSVIEWENPDPNELFSLWSENGDEIKNASKLLVKPGQGVIFVYEGQVQAVHLNEGLYELATANIPFLTTVMKVMQSFESEHKVGIYYFWRTEFLNQKWGTTSPIKYLDPVYKFPVGMRAFGNFSFRIVEPAAFFANVVGSRASFTVEQARKVIAQRFVQQLTDLLAESSLAYIEIDKHRDELAERLIGKVAPEFTKLGFEMMDFRLENTDFDAETQARVGKIADTIAESEAARAAGIDYAQMQHLQALRDAARNEGGAAGAGVGFGAGIGLGQMMAGTMSNQLAGGGVTRNDIASRLKQLDELRSQNLISQEEFDKKRAEILASV